MYICFLFKLDFSLKKVQQFTSGSVRFQGQRLVKVKKVTHSPTHPINNKGHRLLVSSHTISNYKHCLSWSSFFLTTCNHLGELTKQL